MFNKTKKDNQSATNNQGKAGIIGSGMSISGDITTDSDVRVDGKLYGNITSTAKVVVGGEGMIEGVITAQQADIEGQVYGNMIIYELLHLRARAQVFGDLTVSKLSVEPNASFNGNCRMNEVINPPTVLKLETKEESPRQGNKKH